MQGAHILCLTAHFHLVPFIQFKIKSVQTLKYWFTRFLMNILSISK